MSRAKLTAMFCSQHFPTVQHPEPPAPLFGEDDAESIVGATTTTTTPTTRSISSSCVVDWCLVIWTFGAESSEFHDLLLHDSMPSNVSVVWQHSRRRHIRCMGHASSMIVNNSSYADPNDFGALMVFTNVYIQPKRVLVICQGPSAPAASLSGKTSSAFNSTN